MRPGFLVDGYNLLYQMPDLAELLDRNSEQARALLVRRLADFRAVRRVSVTVVFDGADPGYAPDAGAGVRVVFCRSGRTADDEIKARVGREPNPRSITVVTSDNAIVRHVRDFGAKTMRSDEFAGLVAAGPEQAARAPGKTSEEPVDVAEWERWFRERKPDFGQPKPAPARAGRNRRERRR